MMTDTVERNEPGELHKNLSTGFIEESSKKEVIAKVDFDRIGEEEGYVLDEEILKQRLGLPADAVLKKAKDGKTVLIPQPSEDPDDPLNWPEWRKSVVLLVIAIVSGCGDYSSATGSIAIIPQAHQWRITPNTVNHATAGNVFMLGAGGLIVVWFSAFFGRLPVLLFFETLALATVIWCAGATSFASYMTARILNGFFGSVAAGGGLMFIKDIYFFHQHPRKINLWSTALILSPFFGPMVMAAIIANGPANGSDWPWGYGVVAIFAGIGLILTVLFFDETFYPRHLSADLRPKRKSRMMRLCGVEQLRQQYTGTSFFGAARRPFLTILKLPVLLACIYYFFTFAFVIGNNVTISVFLVPEYHFSFRSLAAIYVAPVIGASVGILSGHWLHDWVGTMYAKRHGGRIQPEARLVILWFTTPLNILGLNLIGSTLTQHWSYYVLAVGWGIHNFATIVTATAISAYVLDSYPEASGEVAAWINAARASGGFVISYFQINWAVAQGTQREFGIQSGVVGAAFLIVIYLQFFGRKLRHKQGPLNFRTW